MGRAAGNSAVRGSSGSAASMPKTRCSAACVLATFGAGRQMRLHSLARGLIQRAVEIFVERVIVQVFIVVTWLVRNL